MKKLIVTCHPSSYGFTHRIARIYKDSAEKSSHECFLMDLYQEEWNQDFLKFEDVRNWPADNVREKIQQKISWADEIVFIFPLWWGFMPAKLKNFIDCNITAGFAYKFEGKVFPKKLLLGKIATVFVTSDGPRFFQYAFFFPLRILLKYMIFGFCGIRLQKVFLFDKMITRNESSRLQLLKKVEEFAKK